MENENHLKKQQIRISNNGRSVTVVERTFDKTTGIQVPGTETKVGTIVFDPELTSAKKVETYAKTRKWGYAEEPRVTQNQTLLYDAIDLGPVEELETADPESVKHV